MLPSLVEISTHKSREIGSESKNRNRGRVRVELCREIREKVESKGIGRRKIERERGYGKGVCCRPPPLSMPLLLSMPMKAPSSSQFRLSPCERDVRDGKRHRGGERAVQEGNAGQRRRRLEQGEMHR